MRKTATILLLIIFCNSFFYYTYFSISIIKAKIEAAGAIANSDNETDFIKISVAELQKDECDEVWYNNKLYDVAKRGSINGKEYVYLMQDENEQDILNDNSDFFKNDSSIFPENGCKASPQKKAHCVTDDNYLIPSEKKIFFRSYLFRSPTVKNKYYFISFCADVLTPPPRNFFVI